MEERFESSSCILPHSTGAIMARSKSSPAQDMHACLACSADIAAHAILVYLLTIDADSKEDHNACGGRERDITRC